MATDDVEVTERLFLNKDRTKLVPEDSPDAAYLYATPGKRVPKAEAEKYGLGKAAPKPEQQPAKAQAPAESKQVSKPPENKSA